MKKDIEWLKKEIKGKYTYLTSSSWRPEWQRMLRIDLDTLFALFDQLDEPEPLTPEWIDENEVFIFDLDDDCEIRYVPSLKLRHLLVPKQELPVIPKFVANWIEEVKPDNSLRVAFEYIAQRKRDNHDDELAFWVEEGNSETFARAWLDGYSVEEEQKYYIRDQHGVYLLAKNHQADGQVETVAEIVEYYGVEEIELAYELTEEEIKGYDPRYMAFAKPIEELEE